MEFPDLGQHCSAEICKQLDFLPMKCDACKSIFCNDHIHYSKHSCPESYKHNVQVPVCPLCNQPVPIRRGETPDIRVGEHIDRDCQSDPAQAKRNRLYTKKCGLKGCKVKEMISVSCSQCQKNFCLKHRHTQDHNCQGFQASTTKPASKAGAAAVSRFLQGNSSSQATSSAAPAAPRHRPPPPAATGANRVPKIQPLATPAQPLPSMVTAVQGQLDEDEALAMALQNSLYDENGSQQLGNRWPNQVHPPPPVHTSHGPPRRSSSNCSVS